MPAIIGRHFVCTMPVGGEQLADEFIFTRHWLLGQSDAYDNVYQVIEEL